MATAPVDTPARPSVQWKTPPGWKEQPAGGMRVARFSVPGKDGQEADVSIIPLPGISASKRDIVNLWREQIHLGAIKEDELSGQLEKVGIGAGEGELFDMVSDEPLIGGKFKQRIVVAMISEGATTWFFKMTGQDDLVQEQKPAFRSFLQSIAIESRGETSASPHDFTSAGGSPSASGSAVEDAGPAKPEWEIPPNWKEQPPGEMLLAKFLLPGEAGAKAEVTVSSFPGDTGGLLANVNRWRGQVGLTPVEQPELKKLSALDVMGGKATLVDVTGISPRSGQKTRLVGAIVPRDGRTWFYKLMGDEQVAEQQKPAFLKFVQTIRYPNAG